MKLKNNSDIQKTLISEQSWKNYINVSGLRGIVGDIINPEIILSFLKSYIKFLKTNHNHKTKQKKPILLIGRDTRPTSPAIYQFVSSILKMSGFDVYEADIIPTPTLLFNVKKLNLEGGLMITASHNPVEYNAIKPVKSGGFFLNNNDIATLKSINETHNIFENYQNFGKSYYYQEAIKNHIKELKNNFDFKIIKEKQLNISADFINSTAIFGLKPLLIELSKNLNTIFDDPEKAFEREPEPNINTLTFLAENVKINNSDIGFAFDPDSDRVAVVLKNGEIISEEFTLFFAYYDLLLFHEKEDIVINLSTSSIINKIAEKFNRHVFYAPVGEINVTEKMVKSSILFGGEGNGGVIYRKISNSRDTLVASVMILELLARIGYDKFYQLYKDFKNYKFYKTKFKVRNKNFDIYDELKLKLKRKFNNIVEIIDIDGIRINFKDGFIHIRFSNTEPVIRVIAESISEKNALERINNIKEILDNLKILS